MAMHGMFCSANQAMHQDVWTEDRTVVSRLRAMVEDYGDSDAEYVLLNKRGALQLAMCEFRGGC